jgi:hypothetical protein
MRSMLLVMMTVFAVACGDDGGQTPAIDAPTTPVVDAPTTPVVDAPEQIDAPSVAPDAMVPAEIAAACTAACDKLTTCLMQPPTPECNSGCETDLLDCTPEQVQQVQACAALECGADPQTGPVFMCLTAIPCIMP